MSKIAPGALALYRNKCAVITKLSADKIEIETADGEGKSVRAKDIELLHPGPARLPLVPPAAVPDWDEVAELAAGETLPFTDWTEIAYGAYSPESAWAGWLVLQEGIYWTGSVADGVTARPPEAVAATLQALAEKNSRKQARQELLERIHSGSVTPEDRSSLVEIELVAYGERDTSGLMRDLNMEATPENAHRLLLALCVWDDMVNPWPARSGVALTAPDFPLPEPSEENRLDLTGTAAWAIDNAGSDDPDDAIGWGGEDTFWVHVADAAGVIAADSEADIEARNRGCNLYLPEGVIPMLPEAATVKLGLGLQEHSPALSFKVRIDADGIPHLLEYAPSRVNVRRLTYESAETQMEQPEFAALRALLDRFDAWRRSNGGSELIFPEVDIRIAGGEITLHEVVELRSRKLVESAMLAAGRAVAAWALEHDIPMPFVCQEYVADAPAFAGECGDWVESFRRRQYFLSSQVSSSSGRHAGLGLDVYVRVTSPLRRYCDLLAHRQLRRAARGEAPLDAESIDRILTYSENGAALRKQAERRSDDFWRMVWLKRHPDWSGDAQLLGTIREKAVYVIPFLGYEYRTRYGVDGTPGTWYTVTPSEINPAAEECRFRFLGRKEVD